MRHGELIAMNTISTEAVPLINVSHGYWSRPFRNTPPCGDGSSWASGKQESWLLVVDAIGHGPIAHRIAGVLLEAFQRILKSRQSPATSIDELTSHLHKTLKERNQGEQAAIVLCHFDHCNSQLNTIGIGSFESFLLTEASAITLPSQSGMIGGCMPNHLSIQSHNLEDGTILAVASDGLRLPGIQMEIPKYVFAPYSNRSLQESAKLIVNGFYKDHDDASCALARITQIQQ